MARNCSRPAGVAVMWALLALSPFHQADASQPVVVFKDVTAAMGVTAANNAVCWADLNNDGWVDLCVDGSVWTNVGGKRFKQRAGVPGSVVAGDFDNDGFVDLFSWSTLRLFRNQGGKGFVEVKLPKLPACVSRGACWGDFNGDGFVDLFVGGYENWGKQITYPFLILINENGKSFRLDRSERRYRSRGVTACDFDRDGDLDIYVSNYRLQPNQLWLNDGKGRFVDVAAKYGALATSPGFGGGHSIGSAWGDFNNDGEFDLFAGNFAHRDARGNQPLSRFLQNLGAKQSFKFKDLGPCGVHYQESYASPCAGDYDNDGRLDLFFTTVYAVASFGRQNHPVLFRNKGKFAFTDATATARLPKLPPTYQAAWADFDNDGDLDLFAGGKLFQNHGGAANHWLKVRLQGDGVRVNRSAIGAQVRVTIGGTTFTRQVEAGTGEGNQNDLTLHFGLGKHAGPVELEILWPNKKRQQEKGVAIDRTATFRFSPTP